ncbi:hypothetical protein C8A00DRAFT_30420 [Chaetomidium leptoderma]|uniref:Uncharacterized protein n=1 Tax=Chaetomidium leptoderma TaxID=669021 RepID=A0AAN6VUE4_9PEZI|nr:hypothetical protein C8A00DRAFT_30420 [Chaetomidium leptoderma]
MSSTSFRHRLQHQLHIQTQQPQQQQPSSHASSSLWSAVSSSSEPYSAISCPPTSTTSSSYSSRPPLSPRGYSAAAATGQSRFVEGSMNDRVSAAPPPGFLGYDEARGLWGLLDGDVNGDGVGGDGDGDDMPERAGNYGVGVGVGVGVGTGVEGDDAEGRYHLRRPRSTAGWVRAAPTAAAQANTGLQQQQEQQQRQQRGGVVKKTSFLAPLWDGVKEKLNLSKSKSSGSIGRVVNSVVGGNGGAGVERRGERRGEREKELAPVQQQPSSSSTAGYPTREEVMESYKSLVASGFFEAHAIRGGRHPLPAGQGKSSFAEHMAEPRGTMPSSPGKSSFAGHMAVPRSPVPSLSGRSFADHMAAQQQQQQQQQHIPNQRYSAPARSTMGPPPPPRGSSQGKRDSIPSPQRGTKRGASIDFAGDAEMVTRKLVKKLRHSASRLSVELTGGRDNYYYSYGTINKYRRSTSSNPPGPLSPTSSVFSAITSPPSIKERDDTSSIRHGKLTKPKDGRRRRILGLTRRNRSPAPLETTEAADPDAMMIDEPEQAQQPSSTSSSSSSADATTVEESRKIHRILTPPPQAFRTHYPRGLRAGSSSSSTVMSVPQEPLSIVPDANQGIPFVPRIPREFCDAMAAMAPSAGAVVVGGGGAEKKKKQKKKVVEEQGGGVREEGGEGKAKAKNGNRDSGLGEDVENIPVWA